MASLVFGVLQRFLLESLDVAVVLLSLNNTKASVPVEPAPRVQLSQDLRSASLP